MLKKIFSALLCGIILVTVTACGNDEEKSGDFLSGNKWETASSMLLSLDSDNTFKWFNSSSDRKNNYYSGSYSTYFGQDAVDYLEENCGFDPDSQKSTLSKFSVSLEDYCVLILNNEERIIDDKNTLDEPNTATYYGYYKPDYESLVLLNYNTQKEYNFKKK